MVLFTGVFLYAMYSFREWGARVALAEKQGYARDDKDPATPAKPNNALAE